MSPIDSLVPIDSLGADDAPAVAAVEARRAVGDDGAASRAPLRSASHPMSRARFTWCVGKERPRRESMQWLMRIRTGGDLGGCPSRARDSVEQARYRTLDQGDRLLARDVQNI